ncbi:hypothetical protein [Cesiribacter sp. SM1]|uniref:hypothetical protein n=1 Tax=Cesiribacter sp. SM1 TaxID=2861196 RepID=UPI001CD5DD28|nr:hypothetical protein [Cesiribacter sp. SM1]
MRLYLLLVLLLISASAFGQHTDYVDLPTAVYTKSVEVKATSAGGLGKENLFIKIKNLINKVIHVRIPPGLHFKSKDPGAQDLFTVKEVLISLEPGSEKMINSRGFCMQATNYSPGVNGEYLFNGFAITPLKILGDSLAKYEVVADEYGQMFVWAITNNRSLYDISVDSAMLGSASNIMNYVAGVTNTEAGRVSIKKNYLDLPSIETFSKKAVLAFHNPVDEVASFVLYDARGREKYHYFTNQKLGAGVKHYTFGVNETIFSTDNPRYTAKVVTASGKVLAQMDVDKSTVETPVSPEVLKHTMQFSIEKPLEYVKLNIYLENGTLVQEFKRYRQLGIGNYDLYIEFLHLYPPHTRFVAKLEGVNGKVYQQQLMKN